MRDGIRRRKSRGDKKEKEKEKMNGEQALLEIHKDLRSLRQDVSDVMTHGCAKREGDLKEIENLKDNFKDLRGILMWILGTTAVTALGIIGFLIRALWPYIAKL